jgi:phosphoglycolate phosphatase-like HAD superfamily hydrolase
VATEGHPYPAEPDVWVALVLDGTLIDAQTRQVELARFHLLKFGEALDGAELWAKKREGASTRAVLDAMGFSSAAEVAAAWGRDIESREWLVRDRWLPGVCEVLERLRAEGVGLRVVTARQDEGALREQLETLGVTARVDEVVVVDPRRAAIEKAEFLKGAELFVGDTESDAEAAKLAGVPFVAVSTGVRSRAFLEQRGLRVADSLEEALTVGFFTAGRGGASLGGEGVP